MIFNFAVIILPTIRSPGHRLPVTIIAQGLAFAGQMGLTAKQPTK